MNNKFSKWYGEDMRLKAEANSPDLQIFLVNANLEENRNWIYFVMLNLSQDKEEAKIKLLRLFFLMNSLPKGTLNEQFPKLLEGWENLRKELDKNWIEFSKSHEKGIYQNFQLRSEQKKEVCLFFSKCKAKKINKKSKEEETYWKEWKVLSKASATYNFRLLNQVITNAILVFIEEGVIKELAVDKKNHFKIEFDIEPEKIPDILITSENEKESFGIEVVEVSSLSIEKHGDLERFVTNRVEGQIEDFIESKGKKKIEPLFKDIKEIQPEKEHKYYKDELKNWFQGEGKKVLNIPFKISDKINHFDYLIENLRKTIKDKVDKWEKRGCDFKKTALWTVLSALFPIYLYNPKKGEMVDDPEMQEDFLSWFLFKKISEKLVDIDIKFSYLIINFLVLEYCSENSFLGKYNPFGKSWLEDIKKDEENDGFLNEFLSSIRTNDDVKAVIPTFYVPIENGKIKNLESEIEKMKRDFKERWGCDIDSIIYQEFGSGSYNFYTQNLKREKNEKDNC